MAAYRFGADLGKFASVALSSSSTWQPVMEVWEICVSDTSSWTRSLQKADNQYSLKY